MGSWVVQKGVLSAIFTFKLFVQIPLVIVQISFPVYYFCLFALTSRQVFL